MGKIGFISIHRQLQEHFLWTIEPFTKAQAWIDLLLLTNFEPGHIVLRNGEIVPLKRGECGTSMLTLASRWKWSRGKVKRFFDFLTEQRMIQQKNNPKTTIIKIINYEKYQYSTTNDTTNNTTNDTTSDTTNDTLRIRNNNDNNDNNSSSLPNEEEKKLLRNYANKNGVKYFSLWLKKLISNGDWVAIVEQEKEKQDYELWKKEFLERED